MAVLTGGTNAATSLSAIKFIPGINGMVPADRATINNGIKGQNATQLRLHGAFTEEGLLRLPGGRGVLQVLPGDYVMLDTATGWPILVSAYAAANGPWAHS